MTRLQEITGDLWTMHGYHVITTNGSRYKGGRAVLGRGVAAQAVRKYPALPTAYGELIGRGITFAVFDQWRLVCFPVKHFWYEIASMEVIEASADQMQVLAGSRPDAKFFMPVPGIGFGGLNERKGEIVDLLRRSIRADNVILVHRGPNVRGRYASSFRPGATIHDRS